MPTCYPPGLIDWGPAAPELTPEEQIHRDLAEAYAWSTLQVLSAYQIAICPITVRPCGTRCTPGSYTVAPVSGYAGAPFWPAQTNTGDIINIPCRCGQGDCECSWVSEVVLEGPVGKVDSVAFGGIELDAEAYRVDNGNRLVRQDGESWPFCQDMGKPDGEEGTWTVTYWRGAVADPLVQFAATVLAKEYLKGITDDDTCRLPSGTTQAIRQGLTIEIEKDMFDQGLTGIAEVDNVTARFNPFRVKLPAQIFSLDVVPPRMTTYPGGS